MVVLEMRVEPGARLFGSARPGDAPIPYLRRHAISVRARPGEIEEIVRARFPQNQQVDALHPWGLGHF